MSKTDIALVVGGTTLLLYIYAKSYWELGVWSRNLPEMDYRNFHKLLVEYQSGENND